MEELKIKKRVREGYARIARKKGACCEPAVCCDRTEMNRDISRKIGYSEEELRSIPEGANLGLGCGNPVALASLRRGETVLDLGSGPGLDCFLAASKVGKEGRVIGVDMTPDMIDKARVNAKEGEYENVEFRLGEIENLPVADGSIDVIISNCVINLSPNKRRVFKEAFRVLKPGGRIMISDIVLLKELPEILQRSVEAYVGCLSGAVEKDEYMEAIKDAGFQEVQITGETQFPIECMVNDPTAQAIIENLNVPVEAVNEIANVAASITVSGIKPESIS